MYFPVPALQTLVLPSKVCRSKHSLLRNHFSTRKLRVEATRRFRGSTKDRLASRRVGGAQSFRQIRHHGHRGHRFHAACHHDVLCATHHGLGSEMNGLLRRPALPVNGRPGHGKWQAAGEHDVAPNVGRLSPHLQERRNELFLDSYNGYRH